MVFCPQTVWFPIILLDYAIVCLLVHVFCHTIRVYIAHSVCPYKLNGCRPTLRSVTSGCAHSTIRCQGVTQNKLPIAIVSGTYYIASISVWNIIYRVQTIVCAI